MDELEKVKAEIRELEEKAETLRPNSFMSRINDYFTITGWLEYLNFLKCAIRWKQQLEKIIEKTMNNEEYTPYWESIADKVGESWYRPFTPQDIDDAINKSRGIVNQIYDEAHKLRY